MHIACIHPDRMVMLQIRNVPDELHRRLKARAALAGQSLSEYALAELRRSLEKPTRAEVLERIAALPPVDVTVDEVVEGIRADREERSAQLERPARR